MLPGPALIQADLDYRMAGVDKKIRQHVTASQGYSAELDTAFVMAIEMVRLFCAFSNKSYEAFISNIRCDRDCFLELAFSHMTLVCWCKGSLCRFV